MEKPATKFKLLIVDDLPENIKVLGNSLQRDEYLISFATSGLQAIDMVMGNEVDLILLDIMMPGMDGYEVCRRLKAQDRTRQIPIIFITARTEKKDIVRGFKAGAVDYVTKPFNTAELFARVQTHLDLCHSKRMIQNQAEELTWTNKRLMKKNQKLEQAFEEIESLKGLLPVCSNCRKIRRSNCASNRQSSWISLEEYLHEHTAAEVTHSICPQCMANLYPELLSNIKDGS
ncbi:MAG: response regulator [Desulfobacteraceae bacterium]|jgi:DNA-binding response OmpR family regulator